MAIYHLSLIIAMSTIITFPFPEANADARTNIIERHCQKLPPENSSNYLHNYHALLNLMRGEMYKKKFASKEFGIPPSRTYMLSQCMEDLTLTECNTCFAQMNHLLADCLPAISAHVFLDGCFLRLENYSFYGEPFAPFDDMVLIYVDIFSFGFLFFHVLDWLN